MHGLPTLLAILAFAAFALGVRSPTPWTGVAFVAIWGLLFLAGGAWLPTRLARGEGPRWLAPLRFVVVGFAGGLATAVFLWTVSALVGKRLAPGSVALVVLAGAGALRLARQRVRLAGALSTAPLVTTAMAIALGIYLLGANELLSGKLLLFTHRWDWPTHLYWASLIRELGLPLVEPSGVRDVPHLWLYHTGMLVAVAGVEQLSATSLYQAARILGVGCLTVIALGAATLAARFRLPPWQTVICALAALLWAGLALPVDLWRGDWAGVLDPYRHGALRFSAAAGSLYHNLPQLGAVALGSAALVLLDRHRTRGATSDLALCGLLLGASAPFKPSVVIVYAPSVILVLALAGTARHALLPFLLALVPGLIVYLLPALLEDLPAGPAWTLTPWRVVDAVRGADAGGVADLAILGVAVPIALARVVAVARAGRRGRWQVLDVQLLAVLGGVLFADLFLEGERPQHGNNLWARSAALVLAAPALAGTVLRAANVALRDPGRRPLRSASAALGVALLVLQLASGAIYALRYPTLTVVALPQSVAVSLQAITEATPAAARLLADERIARGPQLPYLARRFVHGGTRIRKIAPDLWMWRRAASGRYGPRVRAFLVGRDAVVLSPRDRHLHGHLEELGWSRRLAAGRYELWAPGRRRAPAAADAP